MTGPLMVTQTLGIAALSGFLFYTNHPVAGAWALVATILSIHIRYKGA